MTGLLKVCLLREGKGKSPLPGRGKTRVKVARYKKGRSLSVPISTSSAFFMTKHIVTPLCAYPRATNACTPAPGAERGLSNTCFHAYRFTLGERWDWTWPTTFHNTHSDEGWGRCTSAAPSNSAGGVEVRPGSAIRLRASATELCSDGRWETANCQSSLAFRTNNSLARCQSSRFAFPDNASCKEAVLSPKKERPGNRWGIPA